MNAGVCIHCKKRVYRDDERTGRYRFTDRADGSDIFGSGSECPGNERGHAVDAKVVA